MRLLIITLLLSTYCAVQAQSSLYSGGEDQEAKKLIEQIIQEYNSYQSLKLNFILTTKHPTFTQTDTIRGFASGNKYRLSSSQQHIVCDGDMVYFHLIDQNKILSSKPDPSEVNIIYPAEMLRIYKENYYYRIAGSYPYEESKELIKMEFFPKTGLEKFSKINVYIDKASNQIIRVSKFGKDGVLNTMDLEDLIYNIKLPESLFKIEMS